jgi:(1->4)-alpha-D-glucan 1-alpha-D-glucosylmutase
MQAYMQKALREAKLRTSWSAPAAAYEEAVEAFQRAAFADRGFLADFVARTEPLRLAGAVTSLAQLAIKIAAPGVPDAYNGTEFWDLSLVDPDNRRPVDFDALGEALAATRGESPESLLPDWRSGRIKLHVMRTGLRFRREHPGLFGEGEYLALQATGAAAEHVVAFARRHGPDWLVVVAPRLPLRLLAGVDRPLIPAARWAETRIPRPSAAGSFRDILFGRTYPAAAALGLSEILAEFPVALLHGTSS